VQVVPLALKAWVVRLLHHKLEVGGRLPRLFIALAGECDLGALVCRV